MNFGKFALFYCTTGCEIVDIGSTYENVSA